MIIGIGMDIVEVARVGDLLKRHPERGLQRLFTEAEVAYCLGSSKPEQSFAARFAAKEAVFKALGTGWSGGVCWNEVEVVPDAAGSPRIRLHGSTRELADSRGVQRTHVSLSHIVNLATAYVVLEGDLSTKERADAV